ncbi:MAG: formimidoylglutamate deiminase [Acidimicrobiales bacterium]
MTRFWCELAWLGGPLATAGVTLTTSNDRIINVERDVSAPAPGDTRLDGLTVPGFANVHSHAFQRALRGRTHGGQGDFWAWREVMYEAAARLDPDNYYELARATYGEMAEAGICSVGEFHYLHHQADGTPYDDENTMGKALLAAAADVGIRITLLDTAYLCGGVGDGGARVPLTGAQLRFGDRDIHRWIERVDELLGSSSSPTSKVGAAIHSVRAVDPESIQLLSEWTQLHDMAVHVHVSEQPKENEACLSSHGLTPIGLLNSLGAVTQNTTLIHATHVTEADVALVAEAGAGCCLCPTTERDLADGIGPSRRISEAGIPISLGSDSHTVIDLLEEARAVEMNQRVVTLERGVHPPECLLTMAATNGNRALHWEGGMLESGASADFTTISLDSARLAGTDPANALASVLLGANADDIDHVVIAGRTVVAGGAHNSIDVPAALDKAVRTLMAT